MFKPCFFVLAALLSTSLSADPQKDLKAFFEKNFSAELSTANRAQAMTPIFVAVINALCPWTAAITATGVAVDIGYACQAHAAPVDCSLQRALTWMPSGVVWATAAMFTRHVNNKIQTGQAALERTEGEKTASVQQLNKLRATKPTDIETTLATLGDQVVAINAGYEANLLVATQQLATLQAQLDKIQQAAALKQ